MGMKAKIGRKPNPPTRGGTLHLSSEWETRLWVYKEAIKHGLSMAQIFDEAVRSIRKRHARYDPQRIVDQLSWDDEPQDVNDYIRVKAERKEIVSSVEKKIKEIDVSKRRR